MATMYRHNVYPYYSEALPNPEAILQRHNYVDDPTQYAENSYKPYYHCNPPQHIDRPKSSREDTKALVQEMLKKRREERQLGGQTTREKSYKEPSMTQFADKNTPQAIVTQKLQEIEDITRDADYFYSTSAFSNYTANGNRTRLSRPPSTKPVSTLKPGNVFERLASDAKKKHSESRLGSFTTRSKPPKHNRSATKDSIKVEDRLLEYQKEKLNRLAKQRAQRQNLELNHMRDSPMISPTSNAIARAHVGAYNSLIERFAALEQAKQKRQIGKVQEKIQDEMEGVKGVPEINVRSKELVRGVKNLLSWEINRRKKLDESQIEKRRAEQAEIVQNTSRSLMSSGSSKYLEKLGRSESREKIEDSLIRYGEMSRRKKEIAAEMDENSYSPKVNRHTPSSSRPFSAYNKYMGNQMPITYESLYDKVRRGTRKPEQDAYPNFPQTARNTHYNEFALDKSQTAAREKLLREAEQVINSSFRHAAYPKIQESGYRKEKVMGSNVRTYAQINQVKARFKGDTEYR